MHVTKIVCSYQKLLVALVAVSDFAFSDSSQNPSAKIGPSISVAKMICYM